MNRGFVVVLPRKQLPQEGVTPLVEGTPRRAPQPRLVNLIGKRVLESSPGTTAGQLRMVWLSSHGRAIGWRFPPDGLTCGGEKARRANDSGMRPREARQPSETR
jgi:hypothetical protein